MQFGEIAVVLFLNVTVALRPAAANRTVRPHAMAIDVIIAVDVCSSVARHNEWRRYTGSGRGVVDPDFLSLVGEGSMHSIGFIVATWSSAGQTSEIVPWTVAVDSEDTADVAVRLRAPPRIDRSRYHIYPLRIGAIGHSDRRPFQHPNIPVRVVQTAILRRFTGRFYVWREHVWDAGPCSP